MSRRISTAISFAYSHDQLQQLVGACVELEGVVGGRALRVVGTFLPHVGLADELGEAFDVLAVQLAQLVVLRFHYRLLHCTDVR
jgi:hypothetical protein